MSELRSEDEIRADIVGLCMSNGARWNGSTPLGRLAADAPPLLAEVIRLRTENGNLVDTLNSVTGERDGFRIDGNASRAERDAARVEVSQLRAKIESVEGLADKWCAATDLSTGKASLVAWAFAAELRAALAAPLGETPGGD